MVIATTVMSVNKRSLKKSLSASNVSSVSSMRLSFSPPKDPVIQFKDPVERINDRMNDRDY